jgi:hypothetical protein
LAHYLFSLKQERGAQNGEFPSAPSICASAIPQSFQNRQTGTTSCTSGDASTALMFAPSPPHASRVAIPKTIPSQRFGSGQPVPLVGTQPSGAQSPPAERSLFLNFSYACPGHVMAK